MEVILKKKKKKNLYFVFLKTSLKYSISRLPILKPFHFGETPQAKFSFKKYFKFY